MFCFLSGVIYFDLKYYKIPDFLTIPAIVVFLILCFLKGVDFPDIVLRIVSTGGLFMMAGLLTSYFLKKETIGGGI